MNNLESCRPPLLYSRSEFEEMDKTCFDIKNILKRFKSTIYESIGMPIEKSRVIDENTCAIGYAYLIDEPYDSSKPQGWSLSEDISIEIKIKRSKGQHNLEECPWRREFRLLKEENEKRLNGESQ
jgi:hypothetical protein